jgi:ADP-ribosyl-[dinitrogen reductase] hydrolase
MNTEKIFRSYPSNISQESRITGAILGSFIGDALGVGCQWYYEPGTLKRDFGPWIDNYVDPKVDSISQWGKVLAHRYEKGVRAGDGSQTAHFIEMLLESVSKNKTYDKEDYTKRIDTFLESLDGEPGDPYAGLWTDEAVRVIRKARSKGISWDDKNLYSPADSSDCAMRSVVLAAAYRNPPKLAEAAHNDARLFFQDRFLIGHQLTYTLFIQAIINEIPLEKLGWYIGKLGDDHQVMKYILNYDTIGSPGKGEAALDPDFRMMPASKFVKIYGLDCQAINLLPAAYYLCYRYPNNFEMAVLSAINSGGNNMARATLTGGIVGAMVGLEGIPEKFIKGLNQSEKYIELARQIASFAVGSANYEVTEYNPNIDALPHSADEIEGSDDVS